MAKQVTKVVKSAATAKVTLKPSIATMTSAKIAEPIGPYTMGRVITMPGVGTWGFSSGCLGMNKKGVIASKKPGL